MPPAKKLQKPVPSILLSSEGSSNIENESSESPGSSVYQDAESSPSRQRRGSSAASIFHPVVRWTSGKDRRKPRSIHLQTSNLSQQSAAGRFQSFSAVEAPDNNRLQTGSEKAELVRHNTLNALRRNRSRERYTNDASELPVPYSGASWTRQLSRKFSPTIPTPRDDVNIVTSLGPSSSFLSRLERAKSIATVRGSRPGLGRNGSLPLNSAAWRASPIPGSPLAVSPIMDSAEAEEADAQLGLEISDCLDLALGDNKDSPQGAWMPAKKLPPPRHSTLRRRHHRTDDTLVRPELPQIAVSTDIESGLSRPEIIPLQDLSGPTPSEGSSSSGSSVSSAPAERDTSNPALRLVHAILDVSNHVNTDGVPGEDEDEEEDEDDNDESVVHKNNSAQNIGDVLQKRSSREIVRVPLSETNSLFESSKDDSDLSTSDEEDGKRKARMFKARSHVVDVLDPFGDRYHLVADVSAPELGAGAPETPPPPAAGPPTSPIRRLCYDVGRSKWLNQLITGMLLAQTALLTWQQWTTDRQYFRAGRYTWVDWVLFFFYIVYTAELAVKIVAFGFWDHRLQTVFDKYLRRVRLRKGAAVPPLPSKEFPAYLDGQWNRIDLVSIGSFWISFGLSVTGLDRRWHITVFRSLMCLKILRLFNLTYGTRLCLRGIGVAMAQCKEVLLFFVCFWLFFAIIGVQSFKESLRRHCVWQNPTDSTDTYTHEFQFCGSYRESNNGALLPYLDANMSPSGHTKGYVCPPELRCIIGENPYGGTVSFDNIFHSLEMVFVVLSANTFTDIMYYTMDSETLAASIYFIVCIFFMTVWLLNLVIAVIINSYRAHLEVIEERQKEGVVSVLEEALTERHKRYHEFVEHSKVVQRWDDISSLFVWVILGSFIYECTKDVSNPPNAFDKFYMEQFCATAVLLFEIVCRFLVFLPGGNARYFFYSICNWIDLCLAVGTTVIIIPPIYRNLGDAYGWLSVLQIARFYRVLMSFDFLRDSWGSIFSRIKPFLHMSLLFLLSIYLMGIIMSRMFENVVPLDDLDEHLYIMQDLPNVMLTLYTVTSTENWTNILYLSQQSARNAGLGLCCAISLIAWFCYSNTVILNIFIAIITENIGVPASEKRRAQIKQFYQRLREAQIQNNEGSGLFDSFKKKMKKSSADHRDDNTSVLQLIDKVKDLANAADVDHAESTADPSLGEFFGSWLRGMFRFLPMHQQMAKYFDRRKEKRRQKARERREAQERREARGRRRTHGGTRVDELRETHRDTLQVPARSVSPLSPLLSRESSMSSTASTMPKIDRSLWLFPPENSFRRFCQKLCDPGKGQRKEGAQPIPAVRDTFSVVMFFSTVAVILIACYTTPLYRKKNNYYVDEWNWILYTDLLFSVLFTVEFIVKIVADGFATGPCAYLRSTWNVIDFIVLISFWATVCAVLLENYTLMTIAGAIRAVRGFRLLTITRSSRDAFQFAIISGARRILTAAIVAVSLLMPFALWGLNLFRGRLGTCSDGVSDRAQCANEFSSEVFKWDVLSPNSYADPYLQFDTFKDSFFTMFQCVSLEGWVDLLSNLMNSTGSGSVPATFASPGNAVFIILFNFFSIVLILNVFVSLIISNYSMQTGVAYLSEQQLAWYEVKKVLAHVKPSKRISTAHMGGTRRALYNMFVNKSPGLERVTMILLGIHAFGLLSEFYPSSQIGNSVRYALFMASTSGLLALNILHLYAFGFRLFFANKWNWFRSFVLFCAFCMNIVSYFLSRSTTYANFNKLLLVTVLFFIIPKVNVLNQLLQFASSSLPSLIAIIYTWFVLFLVFAMALNQVFGLTRLGANTTGNLNARTVVKAMLMLFKCSFGEGWNYIMMDFAVSSDDVCSVRPAVYNSDCGNEQLAYSLFILWNILSMYIFMNILISVVINNFSYVYHGSGPHAAITREELRKFKRAWNKFDPYGTGYMDPDDFQKFMSSLDGVLAYHVYDRPHRVPQLKDKWISRNSQHAYDYRLDFDRLDSALSKVDFEHIKERRMRYERLIIEAQLQAVETDDGPKLLFSDVITEVGFYSRFKDSTCLTLGDFINRTLLMKQINKILRNMKVQAAVKMALTRLRFLAHNLHAHRDNASADFDPWTAADLGRTLTNANLNANTTNRYGNYSDTLTPTTNNNINNYNRSTQPGVSRMMSVSNPFSDNNGFNENIWHS